MNDIEDRLRDAYQAATQTVRHETIRGPNESHRPSVAITRAPRLARRQWLLPLSAAAAFALVVTLTATVLPRVLPGARGPNQHGAPSVPADRPPATNFVLAIASSGRSITIRRIKTGSVVAAIAAPGPRTVQFRHAATGDGRHYVIAATEQLSCDTALYQFSLDGQGRPGKLTTLTSLPLDIGEMAISKNGTMLAVLGRQCDPGNAAPRELSTYNLVTGKHKIWSVPTGAVPGTGEAITSLSLSRNGNYLAYAVELTKYHRSVLDVLPTSAAPGPADERSRTVVKAARFGPRTSITSAALTSDGRAVYFTTFRTSGTSGGERSGWQIRLASVATGQSRVIGTYRGSLVYLVTDPATVRAIAVITLQVVRRVPAQKPTHVVVSIRFVAREIDLADGSFKPLKQSKGPPVELTYIW